MRCVAVAGVILLGLAACSKPDFDERYAEKEKELIGEATALEAELDKRITEKPGFEAAPEPGGTDSTESATD